MRFSVLLFFVTVFVSLSFPQQGEFIYKNLTPDDGLPSNETYDLMQSEDGYMYIATDQGLARFDGEEFKVYNEKDGIPGSAVLNVYPGPNGQIWMRTLKEPCYLDGDSFRTNTLKFSYSGPKGANSLHDCMVYFDHDSNPKVLWQHFRAYELEDDTLTRIKRNTEISGESNCLTYVLKKDGLGRWYATTEQKYKKCDSVTLESEMQNIVITGQFINGSTNISKLHKIYEISRDSLILFSTYGSNYLLLLDSLKAKTINMPPGVIGINRLKGNSFLMNSFNGIYQAHISSKDKNFQHYMRDFFTTSSYLDEENSLWVTSHESGIFVVPNVSFKTVFHSHQGSTVSIELTRTQDKLFALINDQEFWVFSNGNFKKEFSDSIRFAKNSNLVAINDTLILQSKVGYRNSKNGRIIQEVLHHFNETFEDDENIYLSTWLGIRAISKKLPQAALVQMLTNGTNQNIIRFFTTDSQETAGELGIRTESVVKTLNVLWAATINGLYLIKDGETVSLKDKHPILSSRLTALDDFHPNYLAIGSRSSGVFLMHKTKHNVLFPISHSDKIKSSAIRSLYSSNDTLYATSNKGLFMFKLSNDTFYQIAHFDSKNGLPTNDISDIEEHDGKIWIATKKGLVFFQKGSLKPDDYYTPIHLTHFSFDDHQRRVDSTFIQFQKDQRDLTFWYKGISFKSAGDLKYKLILSGPSKDSLVTQNTETRFTNLEPGTYTLKIWAQNNTGNWSLKPATLTFSIPEKFHESIWFYILCFLAFGLFTAFLTFLYQQQKKKLLERKLSTNELEQRALAAQMNPHFIHNTLAAIQQLFNAGDMEECNNYIAMFSKLVRLNLNSIREGYISVETEIKRLQLYLDIEKTRFGNRLSYSIEVDPKVDTSYMEIPAMLLQPFVENALWHGLLPKPEGGEIHIKFGSKEKHLIIEILDNGVGYNPSAEKKRDKEDPSVAMEITRNRLDLLSKKSGQTNDFTIQNRKDTTGTQVIVTLYIGED
jgi:anti-sigma regulatory factor (Ser/Thr protein kinase)